MLRFDNPINLKELALIINAELKLLNSSDVNLSNKNISSIETIENANSEQVTFLANPLYVRYLENTNAAAVIVHPKYLDKCKTAALITNNPRLALAKLLNLCDQSNKIVPNIHRLF